MKKALSILSLLLIISMSTYHALTAGDPDFSYPKDALARAEKLMAEANGLPPAQAGAQRLYSLLIASRAAVEIDPDSIFAVPARYQKAIEKESYAPAKALMLIAEARTYSSIWSRNRWKYSQVEIPLEPLPENIAEWSTPQFKAKISGLLEAAVSEAMKDPDAPASEFTEALQGDSISSKITPTVALTVLAGAIDVAENIDADSLKMQFSDSAISCAPKLSEAYFHFLCSSIDDEAQLRKVYEEHRTLEAARTALLALSRTFNGASKEDKAEQKKTFFDNINLIKESLEKFPSWYGNSNLQNRLAELTNARIEINADRLTAPGKPLAVDITQYFCTEAGFDVFRLPLNDYQGIRADRILTQPLYKSVRVTPCGKDNYAVASSDTITFKDMGTYAIVPAMAPGSEPVGTGDIIIVRALPWTPVSVGGTDSPAVVVTDAATGAPVPNVAVWGLIGYNTRTPSRVGTTDTGGIAKAEYSGTANVRNISLRRKDVRIDFNDLNLRKSGEQNPIRTNDYQAEVFTDRPLYHRGDTVQWMAVVTYAEKGARSSIPTKIAAGVPVKVTVLDANWQEVDSFELTTDPWGRICGAFAARKDGLTGNYSIRVECGTGDNTDFCGSTSVTVSDFKLPTFEVKMDLIERDTPRKGEVTIGGVATTYSGMPVANASVAINVSGTSPWWLWWFRGSGDNFLGTLNATTDQSGRFTAIVPAEMIEQGKSSFLIKALATVTARGGESQEAECTFTAGKPYSLSVNLTSANIDGAKPLQLKVEASGATPDQDVPAFDIRWKVCAEKDSATVLSGNCKANEKFSIDLSALPAARYFILAEPADSALANESQPAPIVLYNTVTGAIPEGMRLFVPATSQTLGSDGKTEILVGVNSGSTEGFVWVYTAVAEGFSLRSIQCRKLADGFHRINVDAGTKADTGKRFVVFTQVNFNIETAQVNLTLPPAPGVRLTGKALRDKTAPGSPETWTLRFETANGKPLEGAVAATMFNTALLNLRSSNWPSTFGTPYFGTSLGLQSLSAWGWYVDLRSKLRTLRSVNPRPYTLKFDEIQYAVVHNMKYAMASRATATMDGGVQEEYEMADMAVANEAAPEMAVETATAGAVGDSGNGGGAPAINFRPAEELQAFWMPLLQTAPDGSVELIFTMPNSIGSWTMDAFAWDETLKSGSLTHRATAAKPLMIQPTLPRFVRQGDRLVATATIYNNSDSPRAIRAGFTFADTEGREVLNAIIPAQEVEAGGSKVVEATVEAPTTCAALSYRIWAADDSFSDGEQGVIPVLESASTVIESTTFYLNPTADKPYALAVDNREGFTFNLQYCQNPIWTVVKAMRGCSASEAKTSTALASALFSRLAARKVITDNPGIAEAIRLWKENPSEEALTSMLAKNEDLKALVLDNTPWVQTAANQTARMQMLAEFLDAEKVEAGIAEIIRKLKELRQGNGGFKWGPWSDEASLWPTETVVTTIGIARSMGLTGKEDGALANIATDAVGYLAASRHVRESEGFDLMLTYAFSLWPEMKLQGAAKSLVERTLNYVVKNRARIDTVEKGYAALILKAFGKDKDAAEMIRSIEQYAVSTPDTGITFPSVDDIRGYATLIQALAEAGVPRELIDGMRQWIIVRAQAMDDLGAWNPDYVIAAVMLTGSVWTNAPVGNYVTLNGRPLALPAQESVSGYFSVQLPEQTGSTFVLTVQPNGTTPSYGSVTRIGREQSAAVEPRDGRDLSIRRKLLVMRDGRWVETSEFTVGERVRVDLTVTARRDFEYLTISDERPAAMQPVEQLPGWIWDGGLGFYRENRDAVTNLFVNYMPKGTYHISYELTVQNAGTFTGGIATIQSQMAPELNAHSGGSRIDVNK